MSVDLQSLSSKPSSIEKASTTRVNIKCLPAVIVELKTHCIYLQSS